MSKYVRLKVNKKGGAPERCYVAGQLYLLTLAGQPPGMAGLWYVVKEHTADILRTVLQNDADSPTAFDILTQPEAEAVERRELEAAHRSYMAGEAPTPVHKLAAAIKVDGAKFDTPSAPLPDQPGTVHEQGVLPPAPAQAVPPPNAVAVPAVEITAPAAAATAPAAPAAQPVNAAGPTRPQQQAPRAGVHPGRTAAPQAAAPAPRPAAPAQLAPAPSGATK